MSLPPVPNVLLIICDDLTYGDLAAHGNPIVKTPNLDRLRDQSVRMERYCSGPLCTPARAALFTGCYPHYTKAIDTYCGRSIIDPELNRPFGGPALLPGLLSHQGVRRTGFSGKWHLGDTWPCRPMEFFEEALWHNAGGLRQPGCPAHWDDPPGDDYFDPILNHNGRWIRTRGYCTDLFTDHISSCIRAWQGDRWFCCLSYNAPHTPCIAPEGSWERFLDAGCRESLAKLYAMVEGIDAGVGRVLDLLSELELDSETIVIFTSDHGAQASKGPHPGGTGGFRFNSGLRGGKGGMYDGGIRTPCFWRWPGHLPGGRTCRTVFHPIDVLPTLLEAGGQADACSLAPTGTLHGTGRWGVMTGEIDEDVDSLDSARIIQWHRGDQPIRWRNVAVVSSRWKLVVRHEDCSAELYDTLNDPGEIEDQADQHPKIVQALKQQYETWWVEQTARGFDPVPLYVGSTHENPTLLTRNDWRVEGVDGWIEDDIAAHYELRVVTTGPYRILAELPPVDEAGRAVLSVGDQSCEVPVKAGQRWVVWPDIALGEGRTTLSCYGWVGRTWRQARYVVVDCRQPGSDSSELPRHPAVGLPFPHEPVTPWGRE